MNIETINGRRMDKDYHLRTTSEIFDFILVSSGEIMDGRKTISVNKLINKILLEWKENKIKSHVRK